MLFRSNFGKRHDWDIYGRRIDGSPSLIILHETSESLQSALYTFKDYHPKVKVETPVNLNTKQKDLLKDFSKSCNEKQHPESSSFFGKMKSFFE